MVQAMQYNFLLHIRSTMADRSEDRVSLAIKQTINVLIRPMRLDDRQERRVITLILACQLELGALEMLAYDGFVGRHLVLRDATSHLTRLFEILQLVTILFEELLHCLVYLHIVVSWVQLREIYLMMGWILVCVSQCV